MADNKFINTNTMCDLRDYLTTLPRYFWEDSGPKEVRFESGVEFLSEVLSRYSGGNKLNRMDDPKHLLVGFYDSTSEEWLFLSLIKLRELRNSLSTEQYLVLKDIFSTGKSSVKIPETEAINE